MRLPRLLLLAAAVPSLCGAATMPAVTMRFVDDATGQPVAGAAVYFVADAKKAAFHGGERANLFIVEGRTDASGTVRFAQQDFWPRPFLLGTRLMGATMAAVSPGYRPWSESTFSGQDGLDKVTRWPHPQGHVVRLREVVGPQEEHAAAALANGMARILFDGFVAGIACDWTRIPAFIDVADAMAQAWNQQHAGQAGAPPRLTSTYDELLASDGLQVSRGCPSPRAFFREAARRGSVQGR